MADDIKNLQAQAKAFDLGAVEDAFDNVKANPYQWSSLNLSKLVPSFSPKIKTFIDEKNKLINIKQAQVDSLISSTTNFLDQVQSLSADITSLQKDITDLIKNALSTGAYYRVIGFDTSLSNNGEVTAEFARVLNSSIFGSAGLNPDPNFPNFTGDTARLGGFVLFFAAPNPKRLLEGFTKLGKFFPGIKDGILGAGQTWTNYAKTVRGRAERIAGLGQEFEDKFNKWKANQKSWQDYVNLNAFKEVVPDRDSWHSLSVTQLIPMLNPLTPGSPTNLASQFIDETFSNIQTAFGVVKTANDSIQKLNQSVQSIQGGIDSFQNFTTDATNGLFNMGLYFHAYGTEYGIRSTEEFAQVIATSMNDATDPNRPVLEGDTLFVGGILATIGAPSIEGFTDTFEKFKKTWQAIGISGDSWGKSWSQLTDQQEKTKPGNAVDQLNIQSNTESTATATGLQIVTDFSDKQIISDSVPTNALVDVFLIKDKDILSVEAEQIKTYTSQNGVKVTVQADNKNKVTVTVLYNSIVTIKQGDVFVGTDSHKRTTLVQNNTATNYITGELMAREDGSLSKEIGSSIIVSFPDGSISQINKDGSSSITKNDGTIETKSIDGTKIIRYPNGVTKEYDKDGTLVTTNSPNDIQTSDETSKGTTIVLEDGSVQHTAPNGTVTITSADGKTVTVQTSNGVITITRADKTKIVITQTERTTSFPDGRQTIEPIDIYDENGIKYTGDIIYVEIDGTKRRENKDGSTEITLLNGTVSVLYSDGSSTTTKTNGEQRNVNNEGIITEIRKDGTKIITFLDGAIKQINPDGTFVVINSDGSVETGKEEGEVSVLGSDGVLSKKVSAGMTLNLEADGTLQKEDENINQTVTVTPGKITTTQADGTIIETTNTQTKTTDASGNVTITDITIEIGTEIINGDTREVAFKVITTTKITNTGEKIVDIERQPIYDVVQVVGSDGKIVKLTIPSIREETGKNIIKRTNFNKTVDILLSDNTGKTTIITTQTKSGEVSRREVETNQLRRESIDSSNEFEE